jgi:nitric oxide reductase subunit B
VGDTIFAVGVLALGWFVLGLKTGWSVSGEIDQNMPARIPAGTASGKD